MSDTYYLYGTHAALACLRNPKRKIKGVFCTKIFFDKHEQDICFHKYNIVDNRYLSKLTNTESHQGIAVLANRLSISDISRFHCDVSSNVNTKVVILDHLTDTNNFGSILRSAVMFGIDAIIFTQDRSVQENGAVAKAASGSLECIDMFCVVNIRNAIERLKKMGFWIVGLDHESSDHIGVLRKLSQNSPVALVLGSEGEGLRQLTKKLCDALVSIPTAQVKFGPDSLNVAHAASIAFYVMRSSGL